MAHDLCAPVDRTGISVCLVAGVYGGWLALTWWFTELPLWVAGPLAAVLVAWHGSLQHEAVHELLTRRGWLDTAIAWPPLGIWLPYPIYRATHRAHHRFEILTDPARDPESFYVETKTWRDASPLRRGLLTVHNTLAGRLLLGPLLAIGQFLAAEIRAVLSGDRSHLAIWAVHLVGVAIVLLWAVGVCGIPVWQYALFFVYGGLALTLLRSFAEHDAAEEPLERSAIVEAGPFFGMLFLNNNLHHVHHRRPDLPWHTLPAYYRTHRDAVLAENGGLLYRGYAEIFRRFLLRPIAKPEHPFL